MNWTLHCGDALSVLQTLPASSVQCVVTSPPYWGLRDYGHADQIGLESSPDAFVAALVAVFAEVRRVLRDDGVCWLNLGDSYTGSGKGGNPEEGKQATNRGSQSIGVLYGKIGDTARQAAVTNVSRIWTTEMGMKPKQLIGVPWRVAFALQADGWYLRSDVIWSKPNPMPESVQDRPTKAHEYVFLLTKSERYWYDADAIRTPISEKTLTTYGTERKFPKLGADERVKASNIARDMPIRAPKLKYEGRATKEYDSAGVQNPSDTKRRILEAIQRDGYAGANARSVWEIGTEPSPYEHFAVMPKALARRCILAGCPHGGVVLDPFAGVATTGVVALEEGRSFVGIELNPKYHALARERLANVAPLLATEVSA